MTMNNAGRGLGVVIALVMAITTAWSNESEPDKGVVNNLVGTWKLVSAKYGGQKLDLGKDSTTIKHITPTHFMWASYGKDGKVVRTAGGEYQLKDGEYVEVPRYGIGSDFDVIEGKPQAFKCKVDGNEWHHSGKLSNGLPIEEVWERVQE